MTGNDGGACHGIGHVRADRRHQGESTDSKHKDEIEVVRLVMGRGPERVDRPRRRRRRRQGQLPGLRLRPPDRQGIAAADEGVRDRDAHQGRHDHGAQGWQGPAGVPGDQADRCPDHQRDAKLRRRRDERGRVLFSSPRSTSSTSPRRRTARSTPASLFKYDILANKVGLGAARSADAGRLHHPVDLPGRAAIRRERLLPAAGPVGDVRPGEPDEDRLAVEDVVAEERADAVDEPADDGRIELAGVAAVEPPDRPGLRPGSNERIETAR